MNNIDRKLRRSATALGNTGGEILEWLHEPEQRAALVHAAEQGLPSIAGISAAFVAKFGSNAAKTMVIRQFVGRAVKIIMGEEGYLPADTGVKLPGDPVFRSGTRYHLRGEHTDPDGNPSSLLDRLVSALNQAELLHLQELVTKALAH
jgi:hypothetical protein